MNEEILKGNWNQMKGEVQKEFGKLTDNDLTIIKGELTILKGVIQEKYGHTKEEVNEKVEEFLSRFED